MKKILFVFNPHSGKGQIKDHLLDIVNILVSAGFDVNIHPTQGRNDAKATVIRFKGTYDAIVCSGGDGTVNEVVAGLMAAGIDVPITYIPAGSTNDFANGLQLPKSMTKAAKLAVEGVPYKVDMGTFNDRSFVYVAAFGAFTEVSYATSQQLKNVLGHQAYIIEGMRQFTNIKSSHMTITANGQTMEGDFIYGMVTNADSVGGFKGITGKNIGLDDGIFEVTLIRKLKNPLDLNNLVSYAITKEVKEDQSVVVFKASKIVFESEERVPWVLDGEFGGKQKRVEIINRHQVATFTVDKNFVRP